MRGFRHTLIQQTNLYSLILLWIILCGCNRTSINIPPETQTPLPAPQAAPGTFSLNAHAFHDLNGNGKSDPGEPSLEGIGLSTAGLHCASDQYGKCSLGRLKRGLYTLQVSAQPGFRFSIHPSGKIYALEEGILALVDSDTQLSVALTEGLLTTPFDTPFSIDRFYDHSPDQKISWWNEADHECPAKDAYCYQQPIGTDKHSGTDFILPAGASVLAAAPGEVIAVNGAELCNSLVIYHGFFQGFHILSGYTHLSRMDVRLQHNVKRGSPIGIVGDVCSNGYPHLHFDVFSIPVLDQPAYMNMIDPYQPTLPLPEGFWRRQMGSLAVPVWIAEAFSPNQAGWWTAANDPQTPK